MGEVDTRIQSEARITADIVRWYTNTYCLTHMLPRCLIFHIPNEGQQHLMAQGVLVGVSDLVVIHATRLTHRATLLWVEVKTPTGRQSPAQFAFEDRVRALGYDYHIVRNVAQFQAIIEGLR